MASLLERKLIVVTGKGGAGKSTIAGALGLLAARRGRRALVVEVGEQSHLAALYGRAPLGPRAGADAPGGGDPGEEGFEQAHAPGVEIELEPGLSSLTLDPDAALIEWMRAAAGRLPARALASSASFRYFAAAAPGAEELVSLVKLHELSCGAGGRHDLVVLDAPATGHALAMLAAPDTFSAIVRGGPLARRAEQVREMLLDTRVSAYLAVARATEMAISETLDLERGLRERLGRDLDAVIVNGTIARRFSAAELARIDALARAPAGGDDGPDDPRKRASGSAAVAHAVARAAHATSVRAHTQRRQIARLRRLRNAQGAGPATIGVPFAFVPRLDRAALAKIAERLGQGLVPRA
jgi:anion-transporting  ArsA/GET3 family ATPase